MQEQRRADDSHECSGCQPALDVSQAVAAATQGLREAAARAQMKREQDVVANAARDEQYVRQAFRRSRDKDIWRLRRELEERRALAPETIREAAGRARAALAEAGLLGELSERVLLDSWRRSA